MNDKEINSIIKDCLNGKKESFSLIVNYFQKPIYHFCYNLIRTHQDAEDAVLEIFFKAYNALPSFNIRYKFSTWLYKIAYNHLVEILRKKMREKKYLESEFIFSERMIESKTPPVVFFEKLDKNRVDEMIGSLSVEYRTVLTLKYNQELSYHQISQILGIPQNTVGSLIWRGKKALRDKYYEGEG